MKQIDFKHFNQGLLSHLGCLLHQFLVKYRFQASTNNKWLLKLQEIASGDTFDLLICPHTQAYT